LCGFPFVSPDGGPINQDQENFPLDICEDERVLRVTPVKGRVIIFYSLYEKGNFENINQTALDRCSLHMGCPVKKGEKFAMNVWLRNKEINGAIY